MSIAVGADNSLIADAIEDAIKDVTRNSHTPTDAGDTLQIKKDAWITAVIDLQRTADRCRNMARSYNEGQREPAEERAPVNFELNTRKKE